MTNQKEPSQPEDYAAPYSPIGIPVWVWALVVFITFLLVIIGIYYASRASGDYNPSEQSIRTGGMMRTPGYL